MTNPRWLPLALLSILHACGAGASVRGDAEPLSEYPGRVHEDEAGNLWFATAFDGVIRYDGEELQWFTREHGLGNDTVRQIRQGRDGALWFATGGGLTRYDGVSFATLTDYELALESRGFGQFGHHRDLWDVLEDRRGRLWIATLDGAWRLQNGRFVRHVLPALHAEHEYEFTPNMVYTVFEDREGVLWFGTDGAGVVRDDGDSQTVFTTEQGLCSDHVCAVVQDARGDLWFGTSNGGVSRYDGATFSTHFRNEQWSEAVGWGRFLGLHVDREGDVWFGRSSPGGGVYRHDGEEVRFYSEEHGLGPGGVIDVSADRAGNLWLGTTSGAFRFDGRRFVHFSKQGFVDR